MEWVVSVRKRRKNRTVLANVLRRLSELVTGSVGVSFFFEDRESPRLVAVLTVGDWVSMSGRRYPSSSWESDPEVDYGALLFQRLSA